MPSTMPTQLTWEQARHLLNRAGFGGLPAEIAAVQSAGLSATLDAMLTGPARPLPVPDWYDDPEDEYAISKLRKFSQEERQEALKVSRERGRDMLAGWVEWMVASPTPADMLQQRMTFFWHCHFASSQQKVKSAHYVYDQIQLFDQEARGSYRKLLHGIIRDPAMLVYLDNVRSTKHAPNENLAREIMELFALGQGAYTEEDIKAGARALTGYSLSREEAGFAYYAFLHDNDRKTIFGKTGTYDGDDFVNLILDHPACAPFMVGRVWDHFAGAPLPPDTAKELASVFRAADYEVKPLLRAMFSHPAFYGPAVMGAQIKSPLQLVVGTARLTRLQPSTRLFYPVVLGGMGQVPYAPPNVKGWPGGRTWITTSSLLVRYTFAELVATGEPPAGLTMGSDVGNGEAMMMRKGYTLEADLRGLLKGAPASVGESLVDHLCRTLLSAPPSDAERQGLLASLPANPDLDAMRRLIGNIMLLPQYQLA